MATSLVRRPKQDNIIIYLIPHLVMFWIILGAILGLIRHQNTPQDRILAVHCRKWSVYLRNHAYSYSNRYGLMAFVILAYHWVTTINMSAYNSTMQFTQINCTVTSNGKV